MISRLLIVIMVLSAIVPQGMMLSRNTDSGLIELTICSGSGSRAILMEPGSGKIFDPAGILGNTTVEEHGASEEANAEICPFAIAAVALVDSDGLPAVITGPEPVAYVKRPHDHVGIFPSDLTARGPPAIG